LVRVSLREGSVEDFLERLSQQDPAMTDRLVEASARREVLRYVGLVNPEGQCSVELKSYPRIHALPARPAATSWRSPPSDTTPNRSSCKVPARGRT
jgi:hypothetical protein